MRSHPSEHEELIQSVLCGELGSEDPSVEALRTSCDECGDALTRLVALDARLVSIAKEQRADLARARVQAGAADEAPLRRSLEAALAARTGALIEGPGSRRWIGWAAAAGLLLGGAWLGRGFLPDRSTAPVPSEVLLGGEIELLEPVGKHGSYDAFRWKGELPPLGWFHVTVRVLDGDKGTGSLLEVDVYEPQWIPTPEQKRLFPATILWEVQAFDVAGTPAGHGSETASP